MTPAFAAYLDAVQARCERNTDVLDVGGTELALVGDNIRTLVQLVRELAGGLSWVSEHRCIDHEPTRTCVENILGEARAALARADALLPPATE